MDSAICLRFGHPTTLRPTKPQYSLPISKISQQRHFVRFSSKPSPKEFLVSGNFVGVFDMRKMFLKDKGNPFKIRGWQPDSEPEDGGDLDAPPTNGKKYLRPIFKKWIDYLASRDESELFPPNLREQHKDDTKEILKLIEGRTNELVEKIKEICKKYPGPHEKYDAEISFTETLISKEKYEEALKLSWLAGEPKPPIPSDISRPLLYKAIIYTMSKDRNDDEVKECWMKFAEQGFEDPTTYQVTKGLEGPDDPNVD